MYDDVTYVGALECGHGAGVHGHAAGMCHIIIHMSHHHTYVTSSYTRSESTWACRRRTASFPSATRPTRRQSCPRAGTLLLTLPSPSTFRFYFFFSYSSLHVCLHLCLFCVSTLDFQVFVFGFFPTQRQEPCFQLLCRPHRMCSLAIECVLLL